MARAPRLALAGLPHVVELRGLPASDWFLDDSDRAAALDALRRATADARVEVHGFGLLEDRVTWLCTPPTAQALSQSTQGFGRRYVADFNRRHGRSGTLFAGRFRSAVVAPGPSALMAMLLVEGGTEPSDEPGDPLWTSRGHHLGRRREPWLTPLPAYWSLGNTPFERERAYAEAVLDGQAGVDWRDRLDHALRAGRPIGSPDFIDQCARLARRRLQPRPRGRPKLR